jgi:hypothetical protein
MDQEFPCNWEVWLCLPYDLSSYKAGYQRIKQPESDEFALTQYLDLLCKLGYKETITIAQDDTSLNVFYDEYLGWRIVTSDVKARY